MTVWQAETRNVIFQNFEKTMQSRLLKHSLNILCRELQRFQMNLTTGNATCKLINEILNALNNKLRVGGIFCDLVKKVMTV